MLIEVRKRIANDPFEKAEFAWLRRRSEKLLSVEPDNDRLLGAERSLLAISRDMEDRILTLSGMYRLTGDRRFAQRAIKEMLAAADFPDWNPSHFLDTAEMTAALGIGYDWLYPVIPAEERMLIKQAIVNKGITPWLDRIHRNQATFKNNWSQVCNGGETVGALAIAETDNPEDMARLREVFDHAQIAMTEIMRLFAPDGGFEEGPMYWNYATAYNVLYLASLDSALGTDFGDTDAPGFDETGNYRIDSIGPDNLYANFGDAQESASPSPQMFWLASRFHKPEYAGHERRLTEALRGNMSDTIERESVRFSILGLFWSGLAPSSESPSSLPLIASFARINQAYLRSSWSDPNGWFLGAKGGDSNASHGHLDLGSFVLDALGERWGIDLGPDSYGLPGYFGMQRWNYYRTRTEGHNTLTVDAANEDLDAKGLLSRNGTNGESRFVIFDLGQAYKGKLMGWQRGFSMIRGNSVLVQDEIDPAKLINLTWHFHTRAAIFITPNGKTATLTENGVSITLHLISPSNAIFETRQVHTLPPQANTAGVTDVIIRQKVLFSRETLAVAFTTLGDQSNIKIQPLDQW